MTSYGQAIKAINPNAEFVIYGPDVYEDIVWLNGTPPISKEDIEAKVLFRIKKPSSSKKIAKVNQKKH